MTTADFQMISWIFSAAILVVDFFIRLFLVAYVPRNRKPTAAMSWLLLIFIVPVFGTIFFFILGSTKLSRKRRAQQTQITKMLRGYTAHLRQQGLITTPAAPHDIQANLAEHLTSLAPTHSNKVSIISGYDEIIADAIEKVERASQYIYVEFYILALDDTTEPFFVALEQAVARGVKVRVLFDAWGSRKFPNFHKMMRRMTEKGIAWHKILPVRFSLCQRQKEMPSYSLFLVAQTIPTKTTSASLTRLFNLLDIVLLLRTHILFPMNRYSVRLFQPHSEVFGSRF